MHNQWLALATGYVLVAINWQIHNRGIMAKLLSDANQNVIFKALCISSFAEALDKNFLDITTENDADRDQILGLYADRNRGSVRINSGYFYTASEMKARISRVQELMLP